MEFNLSGLPGMAKEKTEIPVKVLILGSGPAGLTAALYAARADLEPVLVAGLEFGGQVSLTYTVENYPGFPEGIGGPDLTELFRKQAERFGTRFDYDIATEVDLSRRPFVIQTYNSKYLANSLIITTGATPRHLDVPGEKELTGRGVSYCATCDGWFFKGKDVLVVGGGDDAVEEGLFLTRYAEHVTIVHRRDSLRAGSVLQNRAKENPKMSFQWDTTISQILGETGVESVVFKNLKSGQETPRKTRWSIHLHRPQPEYGIIRRPAGDGRERLLESGPQNADQPAGRICRRRSGRPALQAGDHFGRYGRRGCHPGQSLPGRRWK